MDHMRHVLEPLRAAFLLIALVCLPGWAAAQTSDLTITKNDGSPTAIPGNPIVYTISVGNLGPDPVVNAPVTDTFPATLTGVTWNCVATLGSSCAVGAGAGNIASSVSLLAGGSATYTVNATVASTATGSLSNTATVTPPGGHFDPNLANNSSTDTDTLTPEVDLSILKNDGQANEVPGTTVVYSIIVSNAGPSRALNATVTDTFPAILTGITWTCAASPGSICTAFGAGNILDTVTVAAGGSLTYTVTATVAPGATGLLSNTATVAAPMGTTETMPGNNTSTDVDTLTPQANLGITKTDGQLTDIPGTSITYTISVTNAGPSNAPNTIVQDTFPGSLTGVTWTCVPSGGSSCTAAGAGNINDNVTILASGSLTYTVNATINPGATGVLSNTATVTPDASVTDLVPGNNTATDTTTLTPQADLSISKTDGATDEVPGTPISYTILVANAGPSHAPNSVVTDNFPAAIVGATWTCVPSPGSSCTGAGAGNINDVVNLLAGGTLTYTINATIDPCATGVLSNTATVATGGGVTDPALGNNSSTDSDNLLPSADLVFLGKSDSVDPILVCNYETYAMVIQNNGPSCATGVTLIDPLPTDMIFASSIPTSPTCVNAANTVTCGLGTLLPGDMANVSITAIPDFPLKGQTVINTATVSAATPDPNLANNSASQQTDIKPSEPVVLTKTGAPRFLRQGLLTNMLYNLKFTSLCVPEITHTNVTITDTMPTGLAFVTSVPSPSSQAANVLTYTYPALVGGTIEQITIQATLLASTEAGTDLVNSAVVVDDAGNTDNDSFTGGVRTGFAGEGDLKLTFRSAPTVQAGGNLNSRIVLDNTSRIPAKNVVLILDSPNAITFVKASPAPTSVVSLGAINRATWDFPEVKRKVTIRLAQQMSANEVGGAVLTRAVASADELGRAAGATRDVAVRVGKPTPTVTFAAMTPVLVATPTPTITPTQPTATPTATATPGSGLLSVSINTVTRVVAPGTFNTNVIVDGTLAVVPDVTIAVEFPADITMTSVSPAPLSSETIGGRTIATWNYASVGGSAPRAQIQMRHAVPAGVASGTQLEFIARASAPTHVVVQRQAFVEVR